MAIDSRFKTKTKVNTESESQFQNSKFFSLKTDSELEEMFSKVLNEGISQDGSGYALNFDLDSSNVSGIHGTKINLLLSRLENRLKILKSNIGTFMKINAQTTLFKRNVIKFFLFLKQDKKQKNSHLDIDNKLKVETNSIESLKHSVTQLKNAENKIDILTRILLKIQKLKDSLVKNNEIKKLIAGIQVLFKQINVLFKFVQDTNRATIGVFRRSMFSK